MDAHNTVDAPKPSSRRRSARAVRWEDRAAAAAEIGDGGGVALVDLTQPRVVRPHEASARSHHGSAWHAHGRNPGRTVVAVGGDSVAAGAQRSRISGVRAGVRRCLSRRDVVQPGGLRALLVSRFGPVVRAAVHACLAVVAAARGRAAGPPVCRRAGHLPWFLVACYVNDCAKAAGCALLLRALSSPIPIRLKSMRDLGIFLLFAVALVPAAQRLRRCRRAQRAGSSVLAQLRAMAAG